MTTARTGLAAQRLDLAGARTPGSGGGGEARRAGGAELTRRFLAETWGGALDGARSDGLALAAVGSLARGESGPLSDLDLVLVHDGRTLGEDALTQLAERVWYPVWDCGLRLDHAVRTVAQCRAVAADDLVAAVGLLDLGCVAGDPQVVAAARSTVAHDWRASARRRLPSLLEALQDRHARAGDLAHSVEPDLKDGHGGLRDLSVLDALVAAWLADRQRGAVDEARRTLLDVRDAVHVVSGRGRDRLLREDHDAVAALLGDDDGDALLTRVSQAGRTVGYALDATARRAGQAQRARTLRVGPRRPRLNPLGHGLYEHDGEVVLGPRAAIGADPLLPLRTAVVAARHDLPIAPTTLANLAEKAPALPQPWPQLARDLFVDLLAAGPGLVMVWEGLDQAGLVDRWLPEWAQVRSRPQRSAVHRHTVDRHLIETVVSARPLLRAVARPDLLLLGALLHDLGKVRGSTDHAVTGARRAEAVLVRMGHRAQDVEVVTTLVREHLTLIDLATRRDHEDPGTVAAARHAAGGSREVFDLLVALTEADARAAGPLAWTDWRAGLLHRLAGVTRDGWDPSGPGPDPADPPSAVGAADAVELHDLTVLADGPPGVVVRPLQGAYRVDVVTADRLGLFADTAGLLAAQGFVVRTALLRTLGSVAADEWHVESPGGDAPDAARIVRGLVRLRGGDQTPLAPLVRRVAGGSRPSSRSRTGEPGQARALVVPHASTRATVLEVRAQDRPGLLHDLGRGFAGAGLSVRSAHIATYAGQTLDTFYLTEPDGELLSPARVARTVALVIDTCDGVTAGG